ncbi:MAG: pyridoxamine 5'-phosphate oxidase family protein [Actinomycetota bacterium]
MTEQTTPVTEVDQHPERGAYDFDTIAAILDAGFLCHVGFVSDGLPYVIPMLYARSEHSLYLHGSRGSRMLRSLKAGMPLSIAVTLVDGLVLARSVLHHSMNYRSVVVSGTAREVTDPAEKAAALECVVEHLVPQRWGDARVPAPAETAKTLILAVGLDHASAKVRTGPPLDDEKDYGRDVWAGVVPLTLSVGDPDPDAGVEAPVPDYVKKLDRRYGSAL